LEADRALFFLHEMMWAALFIAAPILGTTLAVGLIISIFQVATQIQELTLTYVPKLLAAALVIILLGGWMMERLTHYASSLYQTIPSLGG
jgi:flagellar biosynthetic protein FliQ